MEGISRDSSRVSKKFIKNADKFEEDLKAKLKWSKQQWIAEGEANSRIHKLSNSLHYWKFKLKPAVEDVCVVITLFNAEQDVKVELLHIIETIESLDDTFRVQGLANFRNPRYVGLYFQDKEIADKVKKQFRMLDDNFVVYLGWALKQESKFAKLTVHWLPLTLSIDVIKEKLEKYVLCVEQERKKMVFMSGREMPVAKVEFKVSYKKDVNEDLVPHLMDINNMEALITISGRKALCLNCDRLGHISKKCDLRYCSTCRSLKAKNHTCDTAGKVRSYADTVKENKDQDTRDPDGLGADIIIMEDSDTLQKQELVKKIAYIQGQLEEVNANTSDGKKTGDKKRSADSFLSEGDDLNLMATSSDWGEEEGDSMDSSMDTGDLNDFQVKGEGPILGLSLLKAEPSIGATDGKGQGVKERGARKNKKKKTQNEDAKNDDINAEEKTVKINKENPAGVVTRSYGKKLVRPKSPKEEARYNKVMEVQEFVFKD